MVAPDRGVQLNLRHLRHDQDATFDLIVPLGRYAADCVSMMEVLGPITETLTELEIMIRQYANT
ncbi:hypothetical protein [Streptomyces asiaticus]